MNNVTWYSTELLYLYFILGAFTGLLIFSAVARRFMRLIKSIPTAYAWNPNSHDKMTCYAVDILKNETKPTLIGWVIKNGFDKPDYEYFLRYVFNELRRGSIDEDMNSDTWKGYKLKAARIKLDTEVAKQNQEFEGTNGAYHFYNPKNKRGLTGTTENLKEILWYMYKYIDEEWWKLAYLKEEKPRISAVHRATIKMTPEEAFLDNEERNYTQDDAKDYFSLGHYHIAFYSIGRILHLLQDMAVPAHVRNSSHANRMDEPPEPLEYYADYRDEELLGSGRGKSAPIDRWTFNDSKFYIPFGAFTQNNATNDPIYKRALTYYSLTKGKILQNCKTPNNMNDRSVGMLMDRLATYTHNNYYSFGTIPWNADSRDPEHFTMKLESTGDPNLSKCKVNPGALFDVLNLMIAESNRVIDFMIVMGQTVSSIPSINEKSFPTQIIDRMDSLNDRIKIINSFSPKIGIFNPINSNKWGELKPLITDLNERWSRLESGPKNLRSYLVFYRDLNNKVLTREDLQKAMEDWVRLFGFDRNKIMEIFKAPPTDDLIDPPNNNKNRNWHIGFHGPYCLVNNSDDVKPEKGLDADYSSTSHIVHTQYIQTETLAIHFSAVLLSTWFEDQYTLSKRGLGLWINSDAPDSSTPPEQGHLDSDIKKTIENDKEYPANTRIFTLGITNHIPVEIDLDLSLTLDGLSEADKQEFLEGLPVKTIMRTDFFQGKSEKHYEHESQLRIKAETPTMVKKIDKVMPFNYSALLNTRIPHKLSAFLGAMKRDEASQFLHKVDDYVPYAAVKDMTNAEPTPFDVEFKEKGLNKPACIALRFEFGKDEDSSSGNAR